MTKEDFDAEVYEYAKSRNGTEDSRMTDRMLAYRAGAEPREKQIQIDAEQIRALQKQNGELTDKVKELEAQIEKMKCCENCAFFKDKMYDICHRIKKLGTGKCAFYKMI